MNHPLLMAIDIGTTNTKAALFRLDGSVAATASRRHGVSAPREGWAEHDAEALWWPETVAVCRELCTAPGIDPRDIAGIGVSALSPALLPMDRDGTALYPAMLYNLDRRAIREIEELKPYGAGQLSTGPKILWLKRNEPEIFEKAAYFAGAPSFLVMKLTGNMVADHAAHTIGGMPYDAARMRWDEEMCAACGVTPDRLPELRYGSEIGGTVTREAAALTGLPEGTPVNVGTGDFPAECCSFGTVYRRSVRLTFGTTVGVNFGYNSSDPLFRDYDYQRSLDLRPMKRGGSMPNGCSTIDWAIDLLSGCGATARLSDEDLAALVRAVPPGADGLVMLPYLNGCNGGPVHNPGAKGALFGLKSSHSHAAVYRASLEALAYSIRMILDPQPGEQGEAVAMAGGIRIPGLLQVVCDVTGYTLTPLFMANAAMVGDAFLAGMACGLFASLEDVNPWLRTGPAVRPDPANRAVYDAGYARFRQLYEATKELM